MACRHRSSVSPTAAWRRSASSRPPAKNGSCSVLSDDGSWSNRSAEKGELTRSSVSAVSAESGSKATRQSLSSTLCRDRERSPGEQRESSETWLCSGRDQGQQIHTTQT